MTKKIKPFSIVLILGMLAVLSIACSGETGSGNSAETENNGADGNAAEGSGDVQEITFVAAQYSSQTEPFLTELVENFESEHSDIKVNLDIIGWDSLEQSVNTMVSTGQTPDILNLNHYAAFVSDDLLMPIEEVISPELKDKIYDSFYEAGKVDGTSYAIPYLASIRGLYL